MPLHFCRSFASVALSAAACLSSPIVARAAPATGLIPIEHFVAEDTYRNPILSPDGRHIAVTTTLPSMWGSGTPILAIIRVADRKVVSGIKMDRFEVPGQYMWVGATRLVVSKARDFGDKEKPTPTGEIVTTEFDGSGQRYLYGYFHPQGRDYGAGWMVGLPRKLNNRFYMGEYNFNSKSSALYDVDSLSGARTPLLSLPFPGLSIVLDNKEQPRFAHGMTRDGRLLFLKYDFNTLGWELDRSNTEKTRAMPSAFTPDDRAFYALVSVDGKPEYLTRTDVDTGVAVTVGADPEFDVAMVRAGRNSGVPLGWTRSGGKPVTHYFEASAPLAQLHRSLSEQFSTSFVTLLTSSEDGQKVLFSVRSDRDPGAFYLYDRAINRADFLFGDLENIEPDNMGSRIPISFKARDGLTLHGYLTLPKAAASAPLPMVLLPHGGPHGIQDDWFFDTDAQFLASRGYAVLQVNYRGSGGRGDAFIKSGFLEWGGRIQEDLIDGVQWAIAQGHADPARICVFGASFGAYSAMMMPVRAPQLFKCAIGYAGVYDLEMLYKGKVKNKDATLDEAALLKRYIGDNSERQRQQSPVALADNIKVPVLLIHGSADDITPVAQGKAMRDALIGAGNRPEYMQVSAEGHGFYLSANRLKVYRMLEQFLGEHLASPRLAPLAASAPAVR
jgi:dipeptidyl aminopeptidase/acylaminoacyl peptidase